MPMPQITVHYFAALREARGRDQEAVDADEGTTVGGLLATLFPGASAMREGVSFARNHEIVPADSVVHDGDVVVFLPPFGGG